MNSEELMNFIKLALVHNDKLFNTKKFYDNYVTSLRTYMNSLEFTKYFYSVDVTRSLYISNITKTETNAVVLLLSTYKNKLSNTNEYIYFEDGDLKLSMPKTEDEEFQLSLLLDEFQYKSYNFYKEIKNENLKDGLIISFTNRLMDDDVCWLHDLIHQCVRN